MPELATTPTTPIRPEPLDPVQRASVDRALSERLSERESSRRAPAERGVRVEISSAARASLARAERAPKAPDRPAEDASFEVAQLDAIDNEITRRSEGASEGGSASTPAPEPAGGVDRSFANIVSDAFGASQSELLVQSEDDAISQEIEEFVAAGSRSLGEAASLLREFVARREVDAAERAETFESVRNAVANFADELQERPDRPEPSDPTARVSPDIYGGGGASE